MDKMSVMKNNAYLTYKALKDV